MGFPYDRVDCKAENNSRASRNGRSKLPQLRGRSRKVRKGKGALASYRGTIYFTENSLKITQNFTVKEGGGGGGGRGGTPRPVSITS